ncbi:hypothetical protein [Ornithinimicrobium pekingense]|uniref:Uncharacterized protein n=1 Tax=Ornithinimicrobium pekingense TaxID=384677 RepID=A0ABQ2FD27_9MICO|nr:hypothetical protein [Ornithinimicrobium pekingense]GGK80406.1 hypothetical protein GCM10011509_31150 [Ornithinimicrobium pekingense]
MTVRDIDRVRRRQRWRARSDRAVTVMAGSLAVVAGLTLLPQAWQQSVISGGCRVLSLGVTDCVARLYEPPAPDLRAVPLCEVDQVVEQMVPTVERQRIRFSSGGELERWVGRDGTIRVVAVPEVPEEGATDGWAPAPWPTTTLLPGVDLPQQAQWTFPDGEGEREFVAALQQQHALLDQRVSAVAALLPDDAAERAEEVLTPSAWAAVGHLGTTPTGADRTRSTADGAVHLAGRTARLLDDTQASVTYTTVDSVGTAPDGAGAVGVVRWGRSEVGRATELIGTWAWQDGGQVRVVHLLLPLAEGDQDEFEEWLGAEGGPSLHLDFLTAGDQDGESGLDRLVAAAGTVATEVRTDTDPQSYVEHVRTQMFLDRRPFGELPGTRGATSLVRPQPSGGDRVAVEVQC